MKLMIFNWPPHMGQTKGSTSYTCLISAAQRLRACLALSGETKLRAAGGALSPWPFERNPRLLLE